jgi:Zn-finger nucleic acid-binding protein
MRSPLNSHSILQLTEIEPELSVYLCPQSGGVWIPLDSYLQWKEQHPNAANPVAENNPPALAEDSKQRALLCPESGRLLLRYRVGRGLQFHVDQSPATGGIWLDKGEWEALKANGLHTQLNLIFTASYQRNVRAAEYEQTMEKAFRARLGDADFTRANEFKRWMTEHPLGDEIRRYLGYAVDSEKAD